MLSSFTRLTTGLWKYQFIVVSSLADHRGTPDDMAIGYLSLYQVFLADHGCATNDMVAISLYLSLCSESYVAHSDTFLGYSPSTSPPSHLHHALQDCLSTPCWLWHTFKLFASLHWWGSFHIVQWIFFIIFYFTFFVRDIYQGVFKSI